MKNLFFILLSFLIVSCTTVDSTNNGIKKNFGGSIEPTIYEPGIHWGISWLWSDMIEYPVTEFTIVEKYEFNDKNSLPTSIEVALDCALNNSKLVELHTRIKDYDIKLKKTLRSATKEITSQYSSIEINVYKRREVEQKLATILSQELPEFYLLFKRVQITDVDLPQSVSQTAEINAKQIELNKLSEAKVIQERNNLEAAKYQAEAKAILSKPEMLELQRIEVEKIWAEKGVSPYGMHNVFGEGINLFRQK